MGKAGTYVCPRHGAIWPSRYGSIRGLGVWGRTANVGAPGFPSGHNGFPAHPLANPIEPGRPMWYTMTTAQVAPTELHTMPFYLEVAYVIHLIRWLRGVVL